MNLKSKLTNKKLVFSAVFTFFLFISLISLNTEINTENSKTCKTNQFITQKNTLGDKSAQDLNFNIKTSVLEPRNTIVIIGDGNFTLENGVLEGSGTSEDPYIIANFEINNYTEDWGVQIINTSSYFKLINCSIAYMQNGIQLNNVTNGIITNNTIHSLVGEVGGEGATGESSKGIELVNASIFNIIEYNTLYNLTAGAGGDSGGTDGGNSGFVYPIYVRDSSANNTINKNIIYDISGGAGGTSTNGAGGGAYPIYGIIVTAANNSISNNTIYNLVGGNGGDGTTTGGSCQSISSILTNEDGDNSEISSNYVYNVMGGNGGAGGSGNGGSGAGINVFDVGESQIAFNLTCYNITSGNGGTSSGASEGSGGALSVFYTADDFVTFNNCSAELITGGTGGTGGLVMGVYASGQLNLTFGNINITAVNSTGNFHGFLAYSSGVNNIANVTGSLNLVNCTSDGTEYLTSFVGDNISDVAIAISTDRNQQIFNSEAAIFNDIFVIIQNNTLINARSTTLIVYEYNITDITNQTLYYSVNGGSWTTVNITDETTYKFPEAANNSITTYYVENEIGSVLLTGKLSFQIYFAPLPEIGTPAYDKGGDDSVTQEEWYVITVTVLRNGIPVEGVWVELSDSQENYIFKLKTNLKGIVEFRQMREGTYSVKPLFGEKGITEASSYSYSKSGLRFELNEDKEVTINISDTSPVQDIGRSLYGFFFGSQTSSLIVIGASIGLNIGLILFTMKPASIFPGIKALEFKKPSQKWKKYEKKIITAVITALNLILLSIAAINVFTPLEIEVPVYFYSIGYSMIILLAVGVISGLYFLFIIIAASTIVWAFIPLTMFYFVLYISSMIFVIVLLLLIKKQMKKNSLY